MSRKAAVFAAGLGLTAVFFGCSRDDAAPAVSGAEAAFNTEDFSYVL